MKILAISDLHSFHSQLKLPPDIQMIICAGDVSNPQNPAINANQVLDFLAWYESLPIKYKIFCAGNHDTSIYHKLIDPRKYSTIDYLEHESIERGGINIFGSPWTPTYGSGWAWNKDRGKLDAYWKAIPENTDILVTHGPPKGILDLSHNYGDDLEYCGDQALFNHVERVKPSFHIFGHIHSNKVDMNSGTRTVSGMKTTFINASCCNDGDYSGLTSHGTIFEFNK